MKVIDITQIEPKRIVKDPNGAFTSNRILIESDLMGFSMTKTVIPKSHKSHYWHYKNHLEACYCVSGKGVLKNCITNETFDILPDFVYALDNNDPHEFTPIEDTILICVFNPPLKGTELHGKDGSYE